MSNVKTSKIEGLHDHVINLIEKLEFKPITTFEKSRENAQLINRYKYHEIYIQIFKYTEDDQEDLEQVTDLLFETQQNIQCEDRVIVLGKKLISLKMDRLHTPTSCSLSEFEFNECYNQIQCLVSDYLADEGQSISNRDQLISILERGKSVELINYFEKMFQVKNNPIVVEIEGVSHSLTIFPEALESSSDIMFYDLTTNNIDLSKSMGQRQAYKFLTFACDEIYFTKSKQRPDLVFLKSGQAIILFSPHRSKERKVLFTVERLKNEGWVKNALMKFTKENLPLEDEAIDIDKVLHTRELDSTFHNLLHDFRISLIQEVLNSKEYLRELVKIINIVDKKNLSIDTLLETIQKDFKTQNLYLAICDGLVLRTIIHRFLEVIHDKPVSVRHDELLKKYTTLQINDMAKVGLKTKGKEFRLRKSAKVNSLKAAEFKQAILALDSEYINKYGGDIHEAVISKATRALEEVIGIEYLCELLDLTKEENYNFKYSDISPDALENYYEKSLETSLKFKLRNGQIAIEVDQGNLARKDLGAYFTPSEVSRFVVQNTLAKKLDDLEMHIKKLGIQSDSAKIIFDKYINLKIIDPTVGGGSFLKEAFKEYCSQRRLNFIQFFIQSNKSESYQFLKDIGGFEKHVLCNNLYGIDLDYKALSVASQTLTLEAVNFIKPNEKLPVLIGRNLKSGNTFVSWVDFKEEWKKIPPALIRELMQLRSKSLSASDERCFQEEMILRNDMINNYKKRKIDIDALTPFSWQLEFPEIFYTKDGRPKEDFGFDIVVGNPPWEGLKPYDEEFADKNFDDVPEFGKNEKKIFEDYLKKKLSDKTISKKYQEYNNLKKLSSDYVDKFGHYDLLCPKYEEVGGGNGDLNTYKLALEIYFCNLSATGSFGVIIPDGICGDKGTRDLRLNILRNGLEIIISFNKTNDVFPDATQAFAVISGTKNKTKDYFLLKSNLKNKKELISVLDNSIQYFDDILMQSPLETKPILSLDSNQESLLLKKYFSLISFNKIDNGRIVPYRELDTTNDMYMSQSIKSAGYKICKGENIGRFQLPSGVLYPLDYEQLKNNKKWYKTLNEIRIAWRDIAGLNDKRRMYCSVIPQKIACFNSLNVIRGLKSEAEAYYYTGVLNSFAYEFLIRKQSRNNHINIFLVKLCPIVEFDIKNTLCSKIVRLSEKIHAKYSISAEIELEALVALVYGFTSDEFRVILNKFEKVDDNYKEKVLGKFIEIQHSLSEAA